MSISNVPGKSPDISPIQNQKSQETAAESIASSGEVEQITKEQKETKAVKTASVAADKKKKDTTKKATAVKNEVKKKST